MALRRRAGRDRRAGGAGLAVDRHAVRASARRRWPPVDVLPIGAEPESQLAVDQAPGARPRDVVRVSPGPRLDWFDPVSFERLVGGTWTVTESSRVGVRLSGVRLVRRITHDLPSEGLVRGRDPGAARRRSGDAARRPPDDRRLSGHRRRRPRRRRRGRADTTRRHAPLQWTRGRLTPASVIEPFDIAQSLPSCASTGHHGRMVTEEKGATTPDVVRRYFEAHDRRDTDVALSAFTPDAHVLDDGKEYLGLDAIRDWLGRASTQFTYTRYLPRCPRGSAECLDCAQSARR